MGWGGGDKLNPCRISTFSHSHADNFENLAAAFLEFGASRAAGGSGNCVSMSEDGLSELTGYGPAMQALTEKQRRYVLAMLANPFGNPTGWARAAGYSDASEACKVKGHYLSHDPRIEAAADEVAKQYLGSMGPILGIAVTMRIARNPKHPKQLRAAEMLLNRVGMHEKTEHHVTVDHRDQTGAGVMERIRLAAEKLGVDPSVLLGENTQPMKLIEGEALNGTDDKS